MIMPYTTVMKKTRGNLLVTEHQRFRKHLGRHGSRASRKFPRCFGSGNHLRSSEPDDFIIRSPTDIAQARAQNAWRDGTFAGLHRVGFTGRRRHRHYDIMLVSVTERTREIGVPYGRRRHGK